MKRLLTAILVAGVGIWGIGGCKLFQAQDTTPEAAEMSKLLKEGWQYYKEGKFDSALAKFDTAAIIVDPSNMEAHLGRGLTLMRKGLYRDAHQEFALIYTPYLQENVWIVDLYVPGEQEGVFDTIIVDTLTPPDTIAFGIESDDLLRADADGRLISSPNFMILASWKLGPIFAANGISFEDADYVYLPVDLRNILIKSDTSIAVKAIDPVAFSTAFTPTTVPLNVTSSSVSYVDSDGPVVFLTSTKSGPDREGELPLLHDWLYDTTTSGPVGDTLKLTMVVLKIAKAGLGDRPDIVWMALAADAHTYYMEAIDNKKAAYLAFAAYLLFPMRGDIPSDANYAGLPGLSDDDTSVLKGLAGVAALGYHKAGWVGNAVSVIRFFGDNTFPNSLWNYLPDTYEEMVNTVGYTKDQDANYSVYQKANQLFFGM